MKRSTLLKWMFICCLMLAQLAASAQINISIQILPPYPTRFTDYASRPQQMIIMLTNTSTTMQRVQLRGAINGDNGIIVRSKAGYRSTTAIELGAGQTRSLNGSDLASFFDYKDLEYTGITQNEFINKGGLPEGRYRLCIRAFNYDDNQQPISPDEPGGCSNVFTISSLEPPMILSPMADEVVTSGPGQVFSIRWNTPVSTPPGIKYRIRMVEVLGNRNPNDAIMTATQPYFFEKEVMTNMYVYNPADPQLTPGRKYALMVEAFDPFQNAVFRNNGRSEVISFEYGKQDQVIAADPAVMVPVVAMASGIPNCDCKEAPGNGTSKNNTVKAGSIVAVNKFKMTVLSVSTQPNGTLSGTGVIPLPFINSGLPGARLRVGFSDLDVNAELRMKAGNIEGIVSSGAASLFPKLDAPQVPTIPMGPAQAQNMESFFSSNAKHMLDAVKSSGDAAGFELPLGIKTDVATVAVGRIYFNAAQAWFDAAAVMDIPDGGTENLLGLSGRNICLTPENLCKTGTMYLSEDFNITALNLKLNKPGQNLTTNPGTFITFDKDGFKTLTIDAEYTFPSGTISDVATNLPVKANLIASATDSWTDWIAELKVPEFYVTGMQSIKFSLGEEKMYYDHSDLRKPEGIPAEFASGGAEPAINTGALTWHGFYIPKIRVILPEIIKNVGGGNIGVEGKNLIIDNNGFTGVVKTSGKILELGNGSMDGWYASIESVDLSFFKSGFKKSSMNGKLVLPGSQDYNDGANQLDYNANLTTPQGAGGSLEYLFSITNKAGIALNALFVTLSLDNTSEFVIKGSTTQPLVATARLSGKLSLSNDPLSKVKVPGIGKLHFPEVHFTNLKLMTQSPFIDQNGFTASLASPQKGLAGFKFTGKASGFSVEATQTSATVGLDFTGGLKLAGEALGCEASTTFRLESGIEKKNSRIVWSGVGGRITDISLAANASLGPLTLNGAVKYYNDVNNADEGFVGALESSIAGMLTINMRARFGTKTDSQGDYNYFDFSALADLGQTGITFAPPVPLALYGFGGGVYYNMALDRSSVPGAGSFTAPMAKDDVKEAPAKAKGTKDPDPTSDAMALLDFNPAGLKLKPERGGFGLQATILFGLTSRNTLDADATFSMGFNGTGGVDYINIDGNARILTDISKPLSERTNASTGAGHIKIEISPATKEFTATIGMELGVPNVGNHAFLHATGGGQFHSGPAGWFLKIGTPANPNTVTVLNMISGKSYFEVGSMIDDMPDIPQDVLDLVNLGKNQGQNRMLEKKQAARTYNPGMNQGLILGSSVSVGKANEEYKFLMFYGRLYAKMGFDLAISPDVSCDGVQDAGGAGGWYARGQAYFGARAALGIEVDLFLFSGKIEIFDAGVGATVSAGLPKPAWVVGTVGGRFSVLNDAISGNFNFRFSMGEKCVNSNADPFAGIKLIAQVSPASSVDPPLPLTTVPAVTFNVKMGGQVGNGKYINGYFEFDDYEQADDTGNPRKRYFLFDNSCVTATLNGQNVTDRLRRLDSDGFALVYESNDYLAKDTKYTFKVEARMKEGKITYAQIMQGITVPMNYEFIKDKQGQIAMQPEETVFKTDLGFEQIPSSEYANTVPLHSHKAVPTAEYGGSSWYLETKKIINPVTFFKYPEGTTFIARVFRDGIKAGEDVPLNMEVSKARFSNGTNSNKNSLGNVIQSDADAHSKWTFSGPQLTKNADYTVLIIAKTPQSQQQNTGVSEQKTDFQQGQSMIGGELLSGSSITAKLRTISSRINSLRGNEFIAGGFLFHTSAHPTYLDKFNAMAITKMTNVDKGGSIASGGNKVFNNTIFKRWIPLESGKYTIRLGDVLKGFNFPVDVVLSGELFNTADRWGTNSDAVFQPEYTYGQTPKNVFLPKLYTKDVFSDFGAGFEKIKNFIATNANIPVSQIQVVMNETAENKSGGPLYCFTEYWSRDYYVDRFSPVGAKVPLALPQAEDNSPQMSANGMMMMVIANVMVPVVNAEVRGAIFTCESKGQMTFTDPIQRQIDKVTNWAVNWGLAQQDPGNVMQSNPAAGFSNVQAWENVSAATGSFMNGSINKNQLNAGVQGAMRGAGMR